MGHSDSAVPPELTLDTQMGHVGGRRICYSDNELACTRALPSLNSSRPDLCLRRMKKARRSFVSCAVPSF